MRINHNISAMITQSSLYQADTSMGKSLEKLSTGLRVNRASDDAAGLAVSERLRAQVRGMDRAKLNSQDGVALLQIAEGALNEIDAILQRQRELAVQASNDTFTQTDRDYLNLEFQQLSEEIQRISGATQYNTLTLLNGDFAPGTPLVLQVGANNGTEDTIDVEIGAVTAVDLGLLKDNPDYQPDPLVADYDPIEHIANVEFDTRANSAAIIDVIDDALNTVNELRADLGSYINRLEHTINNLSNQAYNTQDAEARIRDVDFATETTQFTRNQILVQSSTSMLSQANMKPQSVLSLLG